MSEGYHKKGNQNPPVPTTKRPEAPKGSQGTDGTVDGLFLSLHAVKRRLEWLAELRGDDHPLQSVVGFVISEIAKHDRAL